MRYSWEGFLVAKYMGESQPDRLNSVIIIDLRPPISNSNRDRLL
jgi:hypothetical protein